MSLRCLIFGHRYEFYGFLKVDKIKDCDYMVGIHKCLYCDNMIQPRQLPPLPWPPYPRGKSVKKEQPDDPPPEQWDGKSAGENPISDKPPTPKKDPPRSFLIPEGKVEGKL